MSIHRILGICFILLASVTTADAQSRSGKDQRSEKLAAGDQKSRDNYDITIRDAQQGGDVILPIYFLGDVLHIEGTQYHDRLVIQESLGIVTVYWGLASEYGGPADFWFFETFPLESVGHLFVRTFAGSDHVFNLTDIPSTIYGGDHNDVLVGGSSSDTIYGDDDLAFNPGFDILFGGFGVDWMFGGPEIDILVGGDPGGIIDPPTGGYTPFPDQSFAELAYLGYFDDDGADQLWGGPDNDFFIMELATDQNGNSYSRDQFKDFGDSDVVVFEN